MPVADPHPRSSPRWSAVLLGCYQHRLLSTTQVCRLFFEPGFDRRAAQRVLAELEAKRLLGRAMGPPPGRQALWFATELGCAAAAAGGAPERSYRMTAELASGTLQAHTLAVNDVGLAFVEAARGRGDECSPFDWEHEVAHRIADRPTGGRGSDLLVADAVLHYTVRRPDGSNALLLRFVELDRGTMGLLRLGAKLRAYGQLERFRPRRLRRDEEAGGGWRSLYATFPKLLVVLAGEGAAARRRTLLELCLADPQLHPTRAAIDLSIVEFDALRREGPFAPVFWRPGEARPVDVLGAAA